MNDRPNSAPYHNKKTEKVLRAGEKISCAGSEAEVMYVVAEGLVDLVKDGSVLETVEPGGIFGEMAFVDKQPRIAEAVAKIDCVVFSSDYEKFLCLPKENPSLAVQAIMVMTARLQNHRRG